MTLFLAKVGEGEEVLESPAEPYHRPNRFRPRYSFARRMK